MNSFERVTSDILEPFINRTIGILNWLIQFQLPVNAMELSSGLDFDFGVYFVFHGIMLSYVARPGFKRSFMDIRTRWRLQTVIFTRFFGRANAVEKLIALVRIFRCCGLTRNQFPRELCTGRPPVQKNHKITLALFRYKSKLKNWRVRVISNARKTCTLASCLCIEDAVEVSFFLNFENFTKLYLVDMSVYQKYKYGEGKWLCLQIY